MSYGWRPIVLTNFFLEVIKESILLNVRKTFVHDSFKREGNAL